MQEKIEITNNQVYLILPDCKYKPKRKIGYINSDVFFTYKSDNHRYKFSGTLGICYKFLRYSPENLFSFICIDYSNTQLWISRLAYLHNGRMVEFSKNGLEKQLHLNLDRFHKTRAEADAELRELSLSTGLQFKKDISEKLKGYTGAMKSVQGGLF